MSGERHRSNRIVLLFSLLAMVAAIIVVRWLVIHKRPVGAMTPIEAQAMDMTAMKSPPGVQPVAAEEPQVRNIGSTISLPATVVAYSDEDVVARIPGRVTQVLVYPGDKVRAGQLLARLEADEYAAMANQAAMQGLAAGSMVSVAEREIERLRTMRERMALEVGARMAHETHERANRDTAAATWLQAQEAIKTADANVSKAEAEAKYKEQSFAREERLYKAGAISLDELQQAQSERDAAAAMARAARAEKTEAERAAAAMEKQVKAADAAVTMAMGEHAAARRRVQEVDREIEKARAELAATKNEAAAGKAGATSAQILSGYRQLRALDSAVVTERTVSPGSIVQPGMTVLKLKVIRKVRLQVQVPATSSYKVGSRVTVDVGGRKRTGMISSVFPSQDSKTRTYVAEAIFDNADGVFMPGMYLRAHLASDESTRALAVREEAVRTDADGGKYVWVVGERKSDGKTDWTCTMHPEISSPGPGICPKCKMDLTPRESTAKFVAIRKKVTVGGSDGTYVAVSGVEKSDRVLYRGLDDLVEGTPIQPVEWDESGPKELPAGSGKSTHEGH